MHKDSYSEALKRCPFCGSNAEFRAMAKYVEVRCKAPFCGATISRKHHPKADKRQDAEIVHTAWNRRPLQ